MGGGSSGRTSELSRDLDRIFGIKASTVGRLAATQVIRLSRERALLVGLLQIFFAPAARWVTGSDLAMVCFYNGTATGIIRVWVIIYQSHYIIFLYQSRTALPIQPAAVESNVFSKQSRAALPIQPAGHKPCRARAPTQRASKRITPGTAQKHTFGMLTVAA